VFNALLVHIRIRLVLYIVPREPVALWIDRLHSYPGAFRKTTQVKCHMAIGERFHVHDDHRRRGQSAPVLEACAQVRRIAAPALAAKHQHLRQNHIAAVREPSARASALPHHNRSSQVGPEALRIRVMKPPDALIVAWFGGRYEVNRKGHGFARLYAFCQSLAAGAVHAIAVNKAKAIPARPRAIAGVA